VGTLSDEVGTLSDEARVGTLSDATPEQRGYRERAPREGSVRATSEAAQNSESGHARRAELAQQARGPLATRATNVQS
jgi:hypothetical protein